MPLYIYQHPKTGELFEDIRSIENRHKPFMSPDGVECTYAPFVVKRGPAGWRTDREGFEMDPGYYKKLNPKYVKYKDGHREKYNPSKHR